MHPNNKIIEQLYGAFQIRDASMMAACYHPKASFRDPIFQLQGKEEISAMWTTLCERGSDLRIQYENVQADGNSGSAEWQARYTFSATGRLVENRITAHFKFEEGLIIDHVD